MAIVSTAAARNLQFRTAAWAHLSKELLRKSVECVKRNDKLDEEKRDRRWLSGQLDQSTEDKALRLLRLENEVVAEVLELQEYYNDDDAKIRRNKRMKFRGNKLTVMQFLEEVKVVKNQQPPTPAKNEVAPSLSTATTPSTARATANVATAPTPTTHPSTARNTYNVATPAPSDLNIPVTPARPGEPASDQAFNGYSDVEMRRTVTETAQNINALSNIFGQFAAESLQQRRRIEGLESFQERQGLFNEEVQQKLVEFELRLKSCEKKSDMNYIRTKNLDERNNRLRDDCAKFAEFAGNQFADHKDEVADLKRRFDAL